VLDGNTEMSRMLTTCTASDGSGCTAWTLAPCVEVSGLCGSDDVSLDANGNPAPIGQLYGDFPKGVGNQPMARYVMPWSMSIAKQ